MAVAQIIIYAGAIMVLFLFVVMLLNAPREDGAEWDGSWPEIQGPLPHFAIKGPDVQYGDNGGSRPVARNLQEDLTGTGKEDYVIIASFWAREKIQELRTPLALDLFAQGRAGIRPIGRN